jgi:hypothetical protein
VNELEAQLSDWDAENGDTPLVEFVLDDVETKTELVLTDVRFDDGVIKCMMARF